jgi:hypothetical protein
MDSAFVSGFLNNLKRLFLTDLLGMSIFDKGFNHVAEAQTPAVIRHPQTAGLVEIRRDPPAHAGKLTDDALAAVFVYQIVDGIRRVNHRVRRLHGTIDTDDGLALFVFVFMNQADTLIA